MLFNDQTLSLVQNSVVRAKIMSEEDRREYATELLDTYSGFGKKYLINMINTSFSQEAIKQAMSNLVVAYPILQNFINEFSAVYDIQPSRSFYVDGKLVVDKLPEGAEGETAFLDSEKYYVDAKLKKILDDIYSLELKMRIKNSEAMTNLLNTTIYKVNNREGRLRLDFIPNDVCTVATNEEDPTVCDAIYYLKNAYRQDNINQPVVIVNEYWTIKEWWEERAGKPSEVKPNRASEEWQIMAKKLYGGEEVISHIGSGFPPFWVARAELADDDYWNLKDQDVAETIKQLNLALAELRYLQRYGSFGLKYVVNGKIPEGQKIDLLGILSINGNSGSGVPGTNSDNVQVGEFQNAGRMKELSETIMDCLRFLYSLKGLSADKLITSKQSTTAESKQVDRTDLLKKVQAQQDLWKLNEENLFFTLCAVYNRDNSSKLPDKLTITVDYRDIEEQADAMLQRIEANMVKIQNNIMTHVDWMKEENPDLTDKEAEQLLQRNKVMNDELLDNGAEEIPEVDENGDPIEDEPELDEEGNPING